MKRFDMRLRLCIALVVSTMTSCTLVGLDDVQATPCLTSPTANTDFTEANALCARELSALQPPGECEAWVCALRVDEEVFCTLGAPDADGDGVGDAACLPEGDVARDCDDSERTIAEGLAERCDGEDNDCDGVVDESLLTRAAVSRVEESSGGAGRVAFAESEGSIAALLRRNVGGQQALLDWRRGSGRTPARVGSLTLYDPIAAADDPGLAVGLAGSTTVGVFARNIAGCTRTLVAARIQDGGATSDILDSGLPDPAGNTCVTASPRTEGQRSPAVAVVGAQTLLAWSATNANADSLRLLGGRLDSGLSVAPESVDLGPLPTGARAQVLGLPSAAAFVVAVPRASTVEIRTVTVGSTLDLDVSDALTLPFEGAGLALARGVETETTVAVALAYQTGSGNQGRVSLQRLVVAKATLVPDSVGVPTSVQDRGLGQQMPATVWGESPRGWLVSWVESNAEITAQLVGETSGVAGEPVRVFGSDDVAGDGLELRFGQAVAAGTDPGFSVVSHATTASGALDGLHEMSLTCGGAPSG